MPPRSATRKKSAAASARARKSASKSKQLDVESSVVDQNNTALELGSEGQALATVETAAGQLDGASPEAVQLVISGEEIKQEVEEGLPTGGEEKVVVSTPVEVRFAEEALKEERNVEGAMGDQVNVEIKQEVGILDSNSSEVEEGLRTGVEEKVVVSTPVEVRFAEEVIEEERNVEGVMGDQMNANTESLMHGGGVAEESGTRTDGVRIEGGHEKNDDVCMAEATDNCDNAAKEKVVENAQIEGRGVGSVSTQLDVVPGIELLLPWLLVVKFVL